MSMSRSPRHLRRPRLNRLKALFLSDALCSCIVLTSLLTASAPRVAGQSGGPGQQSDIRKELLKSISARFDEAAEQAPPAGGALRRVLSKYSAADSLPTPNMPRASYLGRYSQTEVEAFRAEYLKYVSELQKNGDVHRQRALFSAAVELLLQSRLTKIGELLSARGRPPVQLIIDTQDVNSVHTRKAATGDSYLILFGVDFLRRLDTNMQALSGFLLRNYMLQNTGVDTEGVPISEFISVPDFVDLAPQVHPNNIARRASISEGGAPRGLFEMILSGVRSIVSYGPLLRSPAVPEDIKRAIRTAPMLPVFVGGGVKPEDAFAQYAAHDPYMTGVHYYMLRDVVTYLLAHEYAHILRGDISASGESRPVIADEVGADRDASETIERLSDTDPRALILAMASFVSEIEYRQEEDPDHPFAANRLTILARALSDLQPNLFIDIDAGQRILQQPLKPPKDAAFDRVALSYSLDHSLLFHLTTSDEALWERANDGLTLGAEVELFRVDKPGVSVARGRFRGGGAQMHQQTHLPAETERPEYYGIVRLALPSDLWSLCPDCGVRLKAFSLKTGKVGGAKWDVSGRKADEMLASLSNLPAQRKAYELLFLARDLSGRGRLEEARQVYSTLDKDSPGVLMPADWLNWAAALPQGERSARAALLDRASRAYPQTQGLAYAAGAEQEVSGDQMRALDYYFTEMNGLPDSAFRDDATQRMIALLARAPKDSVPGRFYEAFMLYLAAQDAVRRPDGRAVAAELFQEASSGFESLYSESQSFAAQVFRAETLMYYSFLRKLPRDEAERMFIELTKTRPSFIPPYGHLFGIHYCIHDVEGANKWLFAGIRQDPIHPNSFLTDAIRTLDQKWDGSGCLQE